MIKEIAIEKLTAAPYNPRIDVEQGTPEYEKLRASIEEFGLVQPVIWNKRTGRVVGGHQRLAVLKDLGWEKVPCEVVDLDETDEKVLNVALNRIKGDWDVEKLKEVLAGIDYEEAMLSGFSADEIAAIMADAGDLLDDDFDYSDWDEETADNGMSYIVTLIFDGWEEAQSWASINGYGNKIQAGSKTTVIRIEEDA